MFTRYVDNQSCSTDSDTLPKLYLLVPGAANKTVIILFRALTLRKDKYGLSFWSQLCRIGFETNQLNTLSLGTLVILCEMSLNINVY